MISKYYIFKESVALFGDEGWTNGYRVFVGDVNGDQVHGLRSGTITDEYFVPDSIDFEYTNGVACVNETDDINEAERFVDIIVNSRPVKSINELKLESYG